MLIMPIGDIMHHESKKDILAWLDNLNCQLQTCVRALGRLARSFQKMLLMAYLADEAHGGCATPQPFALLLCCSSCQRSWRRPPLQKRSGQGQALASLPQSPHLQVDESISAAAQALLWAACNCMQWWGPKGRRMTMLKASVPSHAWPSSAPSQAQTQ